MRESPGLVNRSALRLLQWLPSSEALTNGEAFLAGVSSCGVALIEKYALEKNVPVKGTQVVIEGIRSNAEPDRFRASTSPSRSVA